MKRPKLPVPKLKKSKAVPEQSLRRRVRAEQTNQPEQRTPGDDLGRKPAAFSYHNRRSDQQLNTGRRLDRQSFQPALESLDKLGNFWLQRFGLGILLIVGVVSLISISGLSPTPQIIVLNKDQSSLFASNDATYAAAAGKLFSVSPLNHYKITANTGKISQQLQQQFPELQTITITIPLISHRPVMYVEYSQPALVLANASGSFVLDTNGRAIATGDLSGSTSQRLPTIIDHSGLSVSRGQQVLSSGDVAFMQTVLAELTAKNVMIGAISLPPAASELDIAISGQPYFVKFNLHASTDDAKQQAGTFIATQTRLKSQNVTPASYIDVRVDGRAYYK